MPIAKLKIEEANNYDEFEYKDLSEKLSINTDEQIDKPPVCIWIRQNNKNHRFGTLGNFSVIGGKGKARKTFFVSAVTGAALGDRTILNIRCDFGGKRIAYFDTEQSDYDLHWSAKRAIQLNGQNIHPGNYDVFALRSLDPPSRVLFIENYLENTSNLGMIVIDGVRDLLIDINNPDQSTEITTKVMQWTKAYNIHACLVLHQNPGSDKLRGHLGTEITNKAEMYVSVEVPVDNKDVSIVSAKAVRGAMPFDDYAFQINDNILPELTYLEEMPF